MEDQIHIVAINDYLTVPQWGSLGSVAHLTALRIVHGKREERKAGRGSYGGKLES